MSFSKFKELCEACYVTRDNVTAKYESNPHQPWSLGSDYTEAMRIEDRDSCLNWIFGNDAELSLEQLSTRISEHRSRLISENVEGTVWSTIGNIRSAIARAAADAFRSYEGVIPDQPHFDTEELRVSGKTSPYKDMMFPTFRDKPGGGLVCEGEHHADYEAAGMMYDGDFLALLIAREYDFEERMP